jgi:hypothetical protein
VHGEPRLCSGSCYASKTLGVSHMRLSIFGLVAWTLLGCYDAAPDVVPVDAGEGGIHEPGRDSGTGSDSEHDARGDAGGDADASDDDAGADYVAVRWPTYTEAWLDRELLSLATAELAAMDCVITLDETRRRQRRRTLWLRVRRRGCARAQREVEEPRVQAGRLRVHAGWRGVCEVPRRWLLRALLSSRRVTIVSS